MISDTFVEKVYFSLNREYMRRLLTKYFWQKGFKENMDRKIYPPLLQDMAIAIPQFIGKIEIEPQVNDINPTTGTVTIGWNMFVLGNKRMFLGESTHTDLQEIRMPLAGAGNRQGLQSLTFATPKRVMNFIITLLGEHKQGDLSQPIKPQMGLSPMMPMGGVGDTSGYYKRRPV